MFVFALAEEIDQISGNRSGFLAEARARPNPPAAGLERRDERIAIDRHEKGDMSMPPAYDLTPTVVFQL
jgi:hypothetical protein